MVLLLEMNLNSKRLPYNTSFFHYPTFLEFFFLNFCFFLERPKIAGSILVNCLQKIHTFRAVYIPSSIQFLLSSVYKRPKTKGNFNVSENEKKYYGFKYASFNSS
jgi:hypothetical protein